MIYPVVAYGDPVLREKSRVIKEGAIDVKLLSKNMLETMHNAQGVGIAAPQVGLSLRMFVVECKFREKEGAESQFFSDRYTKLDQSESNDEQGQILHYKQTFINPTILNRHGKEWGFAEGCLSIPGFREEVLRPENIKIHYFDENWNEYEEEYDGLIARVIQHEYDHIEGILFLDHLTKERQTQRQAELEKISRGEIEVPYTMDFPLMA
ncbi:peptide deformylase [Xanthovirga aplysinae]|uniref:peptide deformylase n=1 Tax=Xanthovirga aplysinae TaxID=2529853 RepID=UPI0012BD3664|nr:peptide deformylase [Xanthovirga aplysinae]MTI31645.1 peptide deformylase [Xanthovirga aplysinae]